MKRYIAALTVLVFMLFAAPAAAAADTLPPYENAEGYVLMEASTQSVLSGKNADITYNCSYLSKLMSLLLIAEDIETGRYLLSTEVTASQSVEDTKGAVIWLEPGDTLTVEELLKAVIIGNANDAMTVLAEKSEQTVEDFVSRMNSEAFDLGMRNSAFYTPYGTYDEREHSTAHDMGIVCCRLARYEFLRPYFKTWRDFVKEGKTELVSENTLSRTYDRHIGFKACHSDNSGYCIAEGAMNEGGTCYISVVLGAPDSDKSLAGAKKLINTGFHDYKVTATMYPDEMMHPMLVKGGTEETVPVRIRNQERIVIPRGVKELSTVTVLPEYVTAPVKRGQRIGTAGFYSGKELVCETDIIADGDVNELSYRFSLLKLLSYSIN